MDQESTSKGKGKGKRRTAMKMIENKRSLQVTFTKRRKGLFKKAEELSILCGVEIAVIAFSPAGRAFTFGDVVSAMDRLSVACHDNDAAVQEEEEEENAMENRHDNDAAVQEEEEGENAMENRELMLINDGDGSEEIHAPSSTMMIDEELDQWLKNLMDDGAWADSCIG